QLADQFDVHPNQVTTWKAQLEGAAAEVFGPSSGGKSATPPIDVKALHAKIGELTLENDTAGADADCRPRARDIGSRRMMLRGQRMPCRDGGRCRRGLRSFAP